MFYLVGLFAAQLQHPTPVAASPKASWHMEDEESSMPPSDHPNVWYLPHQSSLFQPRSVGPYTLHQVNVDANGLNILGDAANEPSMTVDPTNNQRIAITWRQFDNVSSNFRQAGNAYTTDGGARWHNNMVLTPGTFRSDPVLDTRADGAEFYFSNLPTATQSDQWYSTNRGMTYSGPYFSYGGDKQWIVTDKNPASPGYNNLYQSWSNFSSGTSGATFSRSKDGGRTWFTPTAVPTAPTFGVNFMGNSGDVMVVGTRTNNVGLCFARSTNPYTTGTVSWTSSIITSTYDVVNGASINPDGLAGQVWGAVAPTTSAYSGTIYVLTTVGNFSGQPTSVVLWKSTNNGSTWTGPTRIDTNLGTATSTYHWFGAIGVAPNGRLDVCYNDCGLDANPASPTTCVTVYRSSSDNGVTWTAPKQLTIPWKFGVGYPQQNKIGDYNQIISDDTGCHYVFAATFNNEEDVYYIRIGNATGPIRPPYPRPGSGSQSVGF